MKGIYQKFLGIIEKWINWWNYQFEFFLLHLIVVRKIPKHIAFIMDGNRRFARENNLPTPMGHVEGFQSLQRLVRWLFLLQVPEVTFYAFSIENFKRTKAEVNLLLALARNAILHVKRHESEYRKYSVRLKVLGRIDMLPEDLQDHIREVERETRNNSGFRINIAIAYTSQDDITRGIKSVCHQVKDGSLNVDTVGQDDIERNLMTNDCSPLDVLVRTSGESRLSDFLLWEAGDAMLCFISNHWPNITLWDIIKVFRQYQSYCDALIQKKDVKVDHGDHGHHVIEEYPYVAQQDDALEKPEDIKKEFYLLDNFQRYVNIGKA
ncbi:hypothetical protein DMENIID0001_144000 [Sergentomyia squamirostris]